MTNKERKAQRQKVIDLMMSTSRDDFKLGYNIATTQDYRLMSFEWLKIINSGKIKINRDLFYRLQKDMSAKELAHYYRYEK